MKPKHTPGPWEARAFHGPQYSRYEIKDTIGNDIVLLDYEIRDEDEGLPTNEQREADAALIAAAPEMLRFLEDCAKIKTAFKSAKFPPGLEELIAKATNQNKGAKQ